MGPKRWGQLCVNINRETSKEDKFILVLGQDPPEYDPPMIKTPPPPPPTR